MFRQMFRGHNYLRELQHDVEFAQERERLSAYRSKQAEAAFRAALPDGEYVFDHSHRTAKIPHIRDLRETFREAHRLHSLDKTLLREAEEAYYIWPEDRH